MACDTTAFSIPPVVWMNACHRNGVLILGGIFTYQTQNFIDFNTLMADAATAATAANQLVAIAQYYGFDGYMVDIESFSNIGSLSSGGTINVDNFQLFLSTLRAGLHSNSPHAFLMYYETINGQSNEQNINQSFNELCAQNQMFLQSGSTVVSDGMFCNYGWNRAMVASSAALAEELNRSPLAVYMGIAVSQVSPNPFETWKVMKTCVENDVSIALWGANWPFSQRSMTTAERKRSSSWCLHRRDK